MLIAIATLLTINIILNIIQIVLLTKEEMKATQEANDGMTPLDI